MASLNSKELFDLQLRFAKILSDKGIYSYEHSLFSNTMLFVRLFGYHDEHPPVESDERWQSVVARMPHDYGAQLDYFYDLYLDYEKNKVPGVSNQIGFGCFSYSYHSDTNKYELHFRANDPQGNLNNDRQMLRKEELKAMFTDIKSKKRGATIFVTTWLLGIPAFSRLFPPEFKDQAKLWNIGTAQTLTFWGQFIDKTGLMKQHLADQLIENVKERNYDDVNQYFPLPALISEIPLEVFFRYYDIV